MIKRLTLLTLFTLLSFAAVPDTKFTAKPSNDTPNERLEVLKVIVINVLPENNKISTYIFTKDDLDRVLANIKENSTPKDKYGLSTTARSYFFF